MFVVLIILVELIHLEYVRNRVTQLFVCECNIRVRVNVFVCINVRLRVHVYVFIYIHTGNVRRTCTDQLKSRYTVDFEYGNKNMNSIYRNFTYLPYEFAIHVFVLPDSIAANTKKTRPVKPIKISLLNGASIFFHDEIE